MAKKIVIGRFGKVYGIKGWIRVISYTDPQENILKYSAWLINKDHVWQSVTIANGKRHGKGSIVKLPNIDDRDIAKAYTNLDIYIDRKQLPKLAKGEYYWSDLIGLTVINKSGKILGKVSHLLATGANDVLVVKNGKEQLIPFIKEVIINIEHNTITVDWHEF